MKRVLKYLGILIVIIVLGILYFLFIHKADLRTELVKNDPQPVEGRALLMRMAAAHNISKWDSIDTYSVAFQDEFFGTMGKQSNPYPSNPAEMTLDYIPNSYNGRMTFTNGYLWGIQSWNTYTGQPDREVIFQEHKEAEFYLPTYQYFIEVPLRIQTATAVSYAGEKEIRGRLCKGIFASWNDYAPQHDVDQYILWIDSESYMIQQLEYTVRDFFGFISSACNYLDYKTYAGIPLPSRIPVNNIMGMEGILHQMRIKEIKFNAVSKDELLPNPDLEYMADEKPVVAEL